MLKGVNWIAVLIAFVLLELVGYVWYGVIFKTSWMAEMSAIGLKPEMSNGAANTSIVEGMVLTIVQVLGLAWLFGKLGVATLGAGITTALAVWVVFALTTQGMEFVYMGFTPKLMAINCGQLAVAYLLSGAVLGGVKFGAPKAA